MTLVKIQKKKKMKENKVKIEKSKMIYICMSVYKLRIQDGGDGAHVVSQFYVFC